MKENSELKLLYRKYIDNQLSANEIRDLLTALGEISADDLNKMTADVLFEAAEFSENSHDEDQRLAQIFAGVKEKQKQQAMANLQIKQQIPANLIRKKLYTWLSGAAAAILITGSVIYFSGGDSLEKQATLANLQPGKNKAILTLANGSRITLDDAANGNLAQQSGVQIVKTKGGQLVYNATPTTANAHEQNTIETPYGGQYTIVLPDHSRVWLNAGSSLSYPVSFADSKSRLVQLKGEAYFEVAKDHVHPFIVKTDKQEVEVLGTHFNINSYTDEPTTLTTLLEGSVRVYSGTDHKILKPGDQAILNTQGLKIGQANTEEVMAWKNGYFRFNDEKIESVMRKIARWYDVEIEFQGEISQEEYNGKISRFKSIAQVLDLLGSTNTVHFKINGRRILVLK